MEYRKDLQRSYLVLQADGGLDEIPYPMRMVTENKIEGLLECTCRRIDRDILYYYDITSKHSLAERCRCKKLTGQELLLLLRWLLKTVENIEDFLLEGKGICLQTEYIYLDAQMTAVSFCYMPEETCNFSDAFRELTETLLPWVDHQDPGGVQVGYGLYHFAWEKEFSIEGLHVYMGKMEKEAALEPPAEKEQPEDLWVEQRRHQEALDAFFEDDEPEKEKTRPVAVTLGTVTCLLLIISGWYLIQNYPQGLWVWGGVVFVTVVLGVLILFYRRNREKKDNDRNILKKSEKVNTDETAGYEEGAAFNEEEKFEEDNVEMEEDIWESRESDATQILNVNHTEAEKTSFTDTYIIEEKFPQQGKILELLNRPVQFLGHLEGTADILLPSKAVSRLHARVRKEGEAYYLCDLNSRNGTWVNGHELQGDKEILLHPGDELRFGDMVYQLRQKASVKFYSDNGK